ncbi:hypothetical protein RDI58_019890 [Solanum bulbocastanum]|uniref:Uncharacterized protein n=1 Tax=Solanum bulbocastanum TaxID=147425 RepID=A0AAN8Y7E4_SOLBU
MVITIGVISLAIFPNTANSPKKS